MKIDIVSSYELPGKIVARIVPEKNIDPIKGNPNIINGKWIAMKLEPLDPNFSVENPIFSIDGRERKPLFVGGQMADEVKIHQEKNGVDETWIPISEHGVRTIGNFEREVDGPLTNDEFFLCEEMFLGQGILGLFLVAILNDGNTLAISHSITGPSGQTHEAKFDQPGWALTTKTVAN